LHGEKLLICIHFSIGVVWNYASITMNRFSREISANFAAFPAPNGNVTLVDQLLTVGRMVMAHFMISLVIL
jgi:hypothetical protein